MSEINYERLVQMVNQISQFFDGQSDHATDVAAVTNHLRRFWDPRMRVAIIAYAAAGGEGLQPMSLDAVNKLAADAAAPAHPAADGAAEFPVNTPAGGTIDAPADGAAKTQAAT